MVSGDPSFHWRDPTVDGDSLKFPILDDRNCPSLPFEYGLWAVISIRISATG